jgi:carboxylesterase type B
LVCVEHHRQIGGMRWRPHLDQLAALPERTRAAAVPDGRRVKETIPKTGNPNGKGLSVWPKFAEGQRLVIDVNTRAEADQTRPRYEFLDQFYIKK